MHVHNVSLHVLYGEMAYGRALFDWLFKCLKV